MSKKTIKAIASLWEDGTVNFVYIDQPERNPNPAYGEHKMVPVEIIYG